MDVAVVAVVAALVLRSNFARAEDDGEVAAESVFDGVIISQTGSFDVETGLSGPVTCISTSCSSNAKLNLLLVAVEGVGVRSMTSAFGGIRGTMISGVRSGVLMAKAGPGAGVRYALSVVTSRSRGTS